MRTLRSTLLLAAALLGSAPSAVASAVCSAVYSVGAAARQDDAGAGVAVRSGGTVPVRVIAGRLVVACDVSTSRRRIPVNLFVEYEGAFGLQLHNRAAAGIFAETADGRARPITIHFPGFEATVPRRELGDEEELEEFTRYHSVALGENAIVGSIGAEVLQRYVVTFDLARGLLQLEPPGEAPAVPLSAPRREQDGSWTLPVTEAAGLAWVPVRMDDGTPYAVALGCAEYDTRIERQLADQLGAPAGDVGPIRLGDFDLAEYVAFRPEPLVLVHPDGALGVLGVNLLEHFQVEVDRVARTARFERVRPPEFPVADRAFFQARADEDPEGLVAFLEEHGDTRLGHEAAELLLTWRIEEGAGDADCADAVHWMYETTVEDLRTTRMLDLMKAMADLGQVPVELAAGELGVDSGRDDRYPNAVHEVHGRLGRVRLERDELEPAWRHLLSAAFGLPTDGRINLDLGRCYEAQGRLERAFSRYVQAVIVPESGPEALVALERLQPRLEGAEPFSVDVVERMIAGKVRSFGAAAEFTPDEDTPARRTVLVEFFTNAHLGDERAGAIGGALGNEGAQAHFTDEHAVFLSWHLARPALEPLCNAAAARRAAELRVGDPAVHVVDGLARTAGAARWRQAEAVYERLRSAVVERLSEASEYALEADARIEDGVLEGELWVRREPGAGPSVDRPVRVRLVLAEAGVLYPGKSTVVVHRAVARAFVPLGGADDGAGVDFTPDATGLQALPFRVELAAVRRANEAHLEAQAAAGAGAVQLLGTRLDPRQVRVVAFVEDAAGEVLQALQVDPVDPADEALLLPEEPEAAAEAADGAGDGAGEGRR